MIIGLSGGPDSVALLHILLTFKQEFDLTIIAAHLDHQWRSTSADDRRWCEQLCASLQVPFEATTLDELGLPIASNGSKEALGRTARRIFFERVAANYGAKTIALGHHADDQQETFFIRLLRGASLTGLTGIKPQDGAYIHPLLCLKKEEIITYLTQHGITYRTDETNNSDLFLRNRIRNNIVPALQATDDRFDSNFTRTLERLQETEDFLSKHTYDIFQRIVLAHEGGYQLNRKAFLDLHPAMQQRILMLWLCKHGVSFPVSHAFMKEMIRFIKEGKQPKHALNTQWSLIRRNNSMEIIHE